MKGTCVTASIGLCMLSVGIRLATGGPPSPAIYCEEAAFSFGVIAPTNALEHVFVIENRGQAPLSLLHVRACCGATATLAEHRLEPGGKTDLSVRMSLEGRDGLANKTFYVKSDDPAQPYYPVSLKGEVRDPNKKGGSPERRGNACQVNPGRVDFGRLRKDAQSERKVTIERSSRPFTVGCLESGVSWLTAEMDASSGPDTRREIRIRTKPPLPAGIVTGLVNVVVSPEQAETVTVAVVARVFADLESMPEAIHLVGGGEASRVQERYVSVFSRAGTAFNILKVEVPDENIGVEVLPVKAGHCRIKLTRVLPDSELDGKLLRMETDYAGDPIIEIPFVVARKRGAE